LLRQNLNKTTSLYTPGWYSQLSRRKLAAILARVFGVYLLEKNAAVCAKMQKPGPAPTATKALPSLPILDQQVSEFGPCDAPKNDADMRESAEEKVVRASDLFGIRREIVIEHAGERYRLRITRRGKLILQK
jgi:hemin uptake protein HemP